MIHRSLFKYLRRYDAFAKTLDDFTTKTFTGGLVTLLSVIVALLLIWFEWSSYNTVVWKPELVVDTSRKQQMDIHFNITFPHLPCFVAGIDIMDAASENQNNVIKSIEKIRLSPSGDPIPESKLAKAKKVAPSNVRDAKALSVTPAKAERLEPPRTMDEAISGFFKMMECGSCYGATRVSPDGSLSCCNSCDDVIAAYKEQGMELPDLSIIEQCSKDEWNEILQTQNKEGCNIQGFVKVNRIPGNFHFAPGFSFQHNNLHMHDLRPFSNVQFDFSHTIHHLSFGDYHPHLTQPLNHVSKSTTSSDYVFNYFVKVVSTDFFYQNGSHVSTNQYAVTQHERDLSNHGALGLPGLFFNVEISPMVVIYREYQQPFTSFLTQLCAIIGGVYTLASLFDALIYSAEKKLLHKYNMGKAT